MASPSGKKSGDPILRFEPKGISLLEAYPTCGKLFKAKGWYDYCDRITSYHIEFTKTSARSFDGHKIEFKSLTL